jgi:hypothetical protein
MYIFVIVLLLVAFFEVYRTLNSPNSPSSSTLRGNSLTSFPNIPNISREKFSKIERLILIPGGGGGSKDSENPGYPEWSKRRIIDANKYYQGLSDTAREETLFVLLSAGSFNSPNSQLPDKRIIFECQHMIDHLNQIGIPKEKIYGDIFSWDTVTNGLSLRLLLEGLSLYHDSEKTITIDVFISDFHYKRMEAALTWVLGLEPTLLASKVSLRMHSVLSDGIPGLTKETLEARAIHEAKGTEMLFSQMKNVKTLQEFYAFIMLGGHAGIRNYLLNDYKKSTGGGW